MQEPLKDVVSKFGLEKTNSSGDMAREYMALVYVKEPLCLGRIEVSLPGRLRNLYKRRGGDVFPCSGKQDDGRLLGTKNGPPKPLRQRL